MVRAVVNRVNTDSIDVQLLESVAKASVEGEYKDERLLLLYNVTSASGLVSNWINGV